MRSNLKNSSAVALNIGTIVIVAIMLLVNQAFAKPTLVSSTSTLSSGVLSYQGTLLDASGNPLTGSFDMTFRIYNTPSGGTPLWEESHNGSNAVLLQNGLFNILLGSINPILDSTWEQTHLFLAIKIESDAEMNPREPISAVPFALNAGVAQTVPNASITSSKVSLTHGEIYGSGEVLALTNSPQIIPSLSFLVSPTTPQVLHVSVTIDASSYSTSCPVVLARLYVDDIGIGSVIVLQGSVRATISTTRQLALTPEDHTVDFYGWCEMGSGSIIMTGQSSVSFFLFSQ